MPPFDLELFLLGVAGGLLPDLIRFVKGRQEGFPSWFSKVGYWVGVLVLMALGGVAAWLGGAMDWQSALAMGFAAPEVISRLVGSESTDFRDEGGFDLRRWWAS